ncbi:hypothetical protein PVT68_05065 [Microbulbifer bruguierae]|uniref:Lipoprotein n=1 Tax=Microbulbifer bruguierae TaxID=3029061 RepID=A0ABY8NFE9_9GAMM|nr:hypothetical protein [Microbulbifer bruguierae]WGL17666.1 hypothetical protein PVT68_05065 [Microbulbifer bruguierae]
MIRPLLFTTLLTGLVTAIAINGCGRKSDTHDPDHTPDAATLAMEDIATTEAETKREVRAQENSSPSSTGDNPNSEGQLICTPEWFQWVNEQVMSTQSEAIALQYPTGLPDVGSDEWFTAVDKLTGGDGAHGPDGGSDEWCFMMQQRLGNTD